MVEKNSQTPMSPEDNVYDRENPYILNNLPNWQRMQHFQLEKNNSYCYKCGFDFTPGHISKTCKYKTKKHKDGAIIKNRMGGYTKNCFHHPNWATLNNKRWRHGKEDKKDNSTNKNISESVVQSKLPLCKKHLAALVMSNEK